MPGGVEPAGAIGNRAALCGATAGGTACAERVRRPDLLRQYAVDRAGHRRFSAAGEITAFRALFERIETGRWPADPAEPSVAAAALGPVPQLVHSPRPGATWRCGRRSRARGPVRPRPLPI